MIIQNVSDENHTDISFTVTKEDINKATKIVQELGKLIEARDISADPNICKVFHCRRGHAKPPRSCRKNV